jgi:hypothetical protein
LARSESGSKSAALAARQQRSLLYRVHGRFTHSDKRPIRPGVSDDDAQAVREVESHLAVWRAMHPEAEAAPAEAADLPIRYYRDP